MANPIPSYRHIYYVHIQVFTRELQYFTYKMFCVMIKLLVIATLKTGPKLTFISLVTQFASILKEEYYLTLAQTLTAFLSFLCNNNKKKEILNYCAYNNKTRWSGQIMGISHYRGNMLHINLRERVYNSTKNFVFNRLYSSLG